MRHLIIKWITVIKLLLLSELLLFISQSIMQGTQISTTFKVHDQIMWLSKCCLDTKVITAQPWHQGYRTCSATRARVLQRAIVNECDEVPSKPKLITTALQWFDTKPVIDVSIQLSSLLLDKYFLTRLLIGWRLGYQPTKSIQLLLMILRHKETGSNSHDIGSEYFGFSTRMCNTDAKKAWSGIAGNVSLVDFCLVS